MLTGSECKGRTYKYNEDLVGQRPEPRYVYERDREVRKKWLNVTDKAVMFDLGAEYGHWTLAALAQGAGMVYALETDPDYLTALRANLTSNDGFRERCSIIKQQINVDDYIDHLSLPPPRINFIRFDERLATHVMMFIEDAMITIKRYKPTIIVCCGRALPSAALVTRLAETGLHITARLMDYNDNAYQLISFS